MALTIGGGPLSRRLGDTRNFTVEGPAHSLLLEPFTRRVRAEVDGVTVLDTVRGSLLHETGLLPQLYAPEEDFRLDLLEPTDTSTHCPFKGDATYRTLRVGDRTVVDAVWAYPDPLPGAPWLSGLAALPISAADRWFDEDMEVLGHLTDPYHRVDLRPTSRRVTVTAADGTVVADVDGAGDRVVLLAETGLVNRFYLPREAVKVPIEPSATSTICSYKGRASYGSLRIGQQELTDAVWWYEQPLDEARGVAGLVCLAHEGLTTTTT
jgi:uncharacterized protein (DUF427 family)